MKIIQSSIILTIGVLNFGQCQLVGSRGIVTLPSGFQYRDTTTVDASMNVAKFARSFQSQANSISENNFRISQKPVKVPQFVTRVNGGKGRIQSDQEVFDFTDSRFVEPLPETKFNKPLVEVELERATPASRFLPGQFSALSFAGQPQVQVVNQGQAVPLFQPLKPFVHSANLVEAPRQSGGLGQFQVVQSNRFQQGVQSNRFQQGVQSNQFQGVQSNQFQGVPANQFQSFASLLPESNFASFTKVSRSIPQGSYTVDFSA
jgi:hypothetical protein